MLAGMFVKQKEVIANHQTVSHYEKHVMAGWIISSTKVEERAQSLPRILFTGHLRGSARRSIVNVLVAKLFLQDRSDNFFLLLSPKFVFYKISDKRGIEGKTYPGFAASPNLVDVIDIKNVNRRVVRVWIKMNYDIGFRMKSGLFYSFKLRNYARRER